MKCPRPLFRAAPLVVLTLLSMATSPALLAQSPESNLADHPGYVDFSRIPYLDPDKLTVEINLSGSLLGILAGALEDDESEFGELITKLRSINVNIFELDGDDSGAVRTRTLAMSKSLVEQGWEAVVRVRDDEEVIQILIRHDNHKIAGLAAMFVDGNDSAGFINIVGDVDPGQVARIGRQLNIRALEVMDEALENKDNTGNSGNKQKQEKREEPEGERR
jgi:hypothetical protein